EPRLSERHHRVPAGHGEVAGLAQGAGCAGEDRLHPVRARQERRRARHARRRGAPLSRQRGRAAGDGAPEAPAEMNASARDVDDVGVARRLRITEIFYSLQGEADTVGFPTVFIRLTGCPLRCQYCDTTYAFQGGEWQSVDAVLARVREFTPRFVCVTGGEPLAQKNCLTLLQELCDANYRVSIETSGAMPLAAVDPRVIRVVDVKTPGSLEERRNRYEDLAL